MFKRIKRKHVAFTLGVAGVLFILATLLSLSPVTASLRAVQSDAQTLQITDRHGVPLTITYQNRWNTYDTRPLYEIPDIFQKAFVVSEDRRFFDHGGVDWRARGSALMQNWTSGQVVRGASSITEQVVRMINPRPRTLWSKWIEGIEAMRLERRFAKADILEFYLNQVPYASNRRGIVQAARYYFDRDLSTLTGREMLALVVLARAPSSYDLYKDTTKVAAAIDRLADKLYTNGVIDAAMAAQIKAQDIALSPATLPVDARHFADYVRAQGAYGTGAIRSTLDSALQSKVQGIIDGRLRAISGKNLHNAAVVVANHTTGEVIAWAVAGANDEATPAREVNAVTVPRQPGSALKPMLYATALDRDWTAATLIDDAPLSEAVGTGLHSFKNYSNIHYGKVTLRDALANSLNIPALLTINHVEPQVYLRQLHKLGFASLDRGVDIYDEGLALGNGEVTLLEMVQAYSALAHRGVYRPLRVVMEDSGREEVQVFSPEAASLIGNILSDPWARRLEFGNSSVLNLPVQTAVKTGTSTDYRDSWAVGYNHTYVVGIWMGNLDHSPTDGVTGATGPALALRSVFNELNKNVRSRPLWLSPLLAQQDVCIEDLKRDSGCSMRSEYFKPGTGPTAASPVTTQRFEVVKPTHGLQTAIDPRIPRDYQKLPFVIKGLKEGQTAQWLVNGKPVANTDQPYLWPMERGKYTLGVRVMDGAQVVYTAPDVRYIVK